MRTAEKSYVGVVSLRNANMNMFELVNGAENTSPPREDFAIMTEREEKQLQQICEKMKYIKSKQKEILSREKKRQRAARTRRLIQIGTLAEKYFDCRDMLPAEFEKFLQALVDYKGAKEIIDYIKKSLPQ